MANYGYNQNKTEFRDTVLKQVEKILEISSSELRDNSKSIVTINSLQFVKEEDTRNSYLQAIENLAYILMPYFDEKMKGVFEEQMKVINSFDFEIIKENEEKYKSLLEKTGESELKNYFSMRLRLESGKKLFMELNLLLKRVDYLSSSVYGDEGDSDEIEEAK
jgi:hypothetical protein